MNKLKAIQRAKNFCELNKYRFTKPRERVLTLLMTCKQAMGAYQILESLSSKKTKISPPTVYRAIEFWQQHGFIHRIESMNAYLACCGHDQHENFCIFICDSCQSVIELNAQQLSIPVSCDIEAKHLTVMRATTEIYGQCDKCS